ncbi:MAG: alpha/beta hydrolase [Ilumatobacteraceae bacterium]
MPVVDLPAATISYRVSGPDPAANGAAGPPVVFVHGFLVDSTLWDGVAELLAAAGVRSFLPDWPLGAHVLPTDGAGDLSPRGVARLVVSFLEALDLHDVTLVGNDTGGAVCQLVLDTDASRIGRVVLTNCDAFENFPPKAFVPLFVAARHPGLTRVLMQPMRWRVLRHSPLGYGLLLRRPRDAARTRRWVRPAMTDGRIRRDIARFCRGVDRRELVDVASRLHEFTGPVRIVWGTRDRCFTLATARRLVEVFPDAELIEVPDVSTFVSVDRPDAVADAIVALHHRHAPA